MMIFAAGKYINPNFIVSMGIETRDYMNGSRHWLVIRMSDGQEIKKEHGYGCNAFEELKYIQEAIKC